MDILTVRVNEVQPILTHIRLQSGVLKVTYRRSPVSVVFPGDRVNQVLTTLQSDHMEVEQASLTLRQAQKAFNSYGKLLAPLLEGERLVAITSRNHVIGGIVSWELWSRYVAKGDTRWITDEGASGGERVLTLVAARNRLADLPESFAREQIERGSSEPILVTKNGHPVFTIVPRPMDDSLLQLLLQGRRGSGTTHEKSLKALHAWSEKNLPGGQDVSEVKLRHIVELTRGGYGLPVVVEALKGGDSAALQTCFWRQMLDLSAAQRHYRSDQKRPEGEVQGLPGYSPERESIGLWLRLVRLSAYALQTAQCLVELGENAEWHYVLSYYGRYEELDVDRATKGLLAILLLCQIDQQVQQEVEQGHDERVEGALVGLVHD